MKEPMLYVPLEQALGGSSVSTAVYVVLACSAGTAYAAKPAVCVVLADGDGIGLGTGVADRMAVGDTPLAVSEIVPAKLKTSANWPSGIPVDPSCG